MGINVKPLADRVIIKPDDPINKTDGGIIFPEGFEKKLPQGEIIAAGRGKISDDGTLIRNSLKVGDRVMFHKYETYEEIVIDGETYLIMREYDVIGILEE